MSIAKKIGAVVLILVGLSEIVPIYTIFSGLSQGAGADNTPYLLGKLFAHVLFAVLFVAFGVKILQAKSDANTQNE